MTAPHPFHLIDRHSGRTLRTFPTLAAAEQAARALARMSNVDGLVRTTAHVAECFWADTPGSTCDDDRCLRHGIDCTRPGCEVPVDGDTPQDVGGGEREAGPLTTSEAVAQFNDQGRIPPGTPGWWRVWGASVQDIAPGDLVATLSDGELSWSLVHELFTARAYPLRHGLVTDGGERFTLGALVPVVVLRRGTHHVLSGSAR